MPNPTAGKNRGKAKEARHDALDTNRQRAYDLAARLFETPNTDPVTKYSQPTKPPKYQQAYNRLWNQFGQPLMRYAPGNGRAWWKRQVQAMIRNALRDAGFVQPTRNRRGARYGPNERADRPG